VNVKVNVEVDPRSRALQEDEEEFGVRGLLHLVPVKHPAAPYFLSSISYILTRPGRGLFWGPKKTGSRADLQKHKT